MQPHDAVRLARAELAAYDGDPSIASDKLVETAIKRHADDNVSAMVVCLHLRKHIEVEAPRRPRLQLSRRSLTAPTTASATPPPAAPPLASTAASHACASTEPASSEPRPAAAGGG